MRRIFILILLIFGLTLVAPVPAADALNPSIKEKVDQILPTDIIKKGGKTLLPVGDLKEDIVPRAIRIFLMLMGTVSLIVFVYAGIMLIIAQGNEEEIKKFKTIIVWSLIGLVFITTSYAIVRGVMQLVFR